MQWLRRNVDALAEQNMEALRAELALDPTFGQAPGADHGLIPLPGMDTTGVAPTLARPASIDAVEERDSSPMLE